MQHLGWSRRFGAITRGIALMAFAALAWPSQAEAQTRTRIFYRENLDRLRAIKKKYDPTNLFRLNPNIEPA